MNYRESKKILTEIKKAKRVLLNCHRRPDHDSIGSALALRKVLKEMGKDVEIICPSPIQKTFNFIKNVNNIKTVDFKSYDFRNHDIFIMLDSSSWDMVTGTDDFRVSGIPLVVIDHHKTNISFGDINLVDINTSSVGEIVFLIFEDWGVSINKDIANYLMMAILGDTGVFQYPRVPARTLSIAAGLMEMGAEKDKIISNIFRSIDYNLIKFWGEVISKMKFDKRGKFVWSAISYEIFNKFGKPTYGKSTAASNYAQVVKGTEFGFIAVEGEKRKLSVSFRSRTGFDTSEIAVALGGGGHVYASACTVEDLPFGEAVKKVLKVARKYAKKSKK